MSLFDGLRHERGAHLPQGVYRLADGGAVCVACLLESLSDTDVLAGRRLYALRQAGAGRTRLRRPAAGLAARLVRRSCRASLNPARAPLGGRRAAMHPLTRTGARRRQFAECVDPAGPNPGLLHEVIARHAEALVSHAVAALAAGGATDGDLAAALLDTLMTACGAAHFLPEMAADRCAWW
jgi:hypothetical protein